MHTFIKSLGSILSIFPSDDYERFVPKESATAQAMKELERSSHSQMEKISRKHPILKNVKVGEYGKYFDWPKNE